MRVLQGSADEPTRDYATWAGALEEFEIWTPQSDPLVASGQVSTPHSAWIGGSGYFNLASTMNSRVHVRTSAAQSRDTESESNAVKVAAAKAGVEEHLLPQKLAMVLAHQDAMIENLLSRCQALEAQAARSSLPPEKPTTSPHVNRTKQHSRNRPSADSPVAAHRNRVAKEQVRPRLDGHRQQCAQANPRRGVTRDRAVGRERSAGRRDAAPRTTTTAAEPKRVPSPGAATPKLGGASGTQRQSSSPRRPQLADPMALARKSTPSSSPARRELAQRSSPGTSAREREGSRCQSPNKSGPAGGYMKQSIPPSWSPRRGGRPGPQRCSGQRTQPQTFIRQQQDDESEMRMSARLPTLAETLSSSADLTGGTGECMFVETAEPMVMTSSNTFNARKTDAQSPCANRSGNIASFKAPVQPCHALGLEPRRAKQGKTA